MKVRYFAWLKQRTGCAEESLELPGDVRTVGELKAYLGQQHPRFAEACASTGVVKCAVNQDYAEDTVALKPGDEVAFFPPVTGG